MRNSRGVRENIVEEGDSTSAGANDIESDTEEFNGTRKGRSAHEDLSKSDRPGIVVATIRGKRQDERAGRQSETAKCQPGLVNPNSAKHVRIKLKTNIKTVKRFSRIENSNNINCDASTRARNHNRGRVIGDERMNNPISIPKIGCLAAGI